ncbi:MAG: YebC/PmpR family DNA-binding transcriptional regulator [Candidatus Omnitrophica bacterium]|nr:YebC/PmpR family DNA-binding transcriptional regulator [Candidatus Omnitrophota bacterium]
MSGHSKWASIKHKKAAVDAKRGKLFSKIAKEITVSAKTGGKDQNTNPRLRVAVNKARAVNMPADNIDRAIKKGTGELPGVVYEEIAYEGYGPKGVAVIVETLTDNKNRTSAEVRNIFSKKGGNMAGTGSVNWMFTKKGFILVKKEAVDEDRLMTIVLDAGAEDMKLESDMYEVTTSVQDFEKVKETLEEEKIDIESAELTMIPSNYIKLDGDDARGVLGLVELLEDHDDVQNVYANFDIPEEILKEA